MIPPGIEPGTLSVLDSRDNHYTMESTADQVLLIVCFTTEDYIKFYSAVCDCVVAHTVHAQPTLQTEPVSSLILPSKSQSKHIPLFVGQYQALPATCTLG